MKLHTVMREMSERDPEKLLSLLNRSIFMSNRARWNSRYFRNSRNRLPTTMEPYKVHNVYKRWLAIAAIDTDVNTARFSTVLKVCSHEMHEDFERTTRVETARAPDGTRCRDITDTTHATAYSRAWTVERRNETSGTPELRSDVYLDRVSARL